jgi:hypothetical protein
VGEEVKVLIDALELEKGSHKVMIDGEEYIPKRYVISDETMHALGKIYSIAFSKGIYDPDARDANLKNIKEIWDLIQIANRELEFKK